MMSHRLHVRTPSRLHFGLLGWGPEVAREFGGIGLMIDSPGIDLIAEPAEHWVAEGHLASRVERIIAHLRDQTYEPGIH
jgi:beta-ribofuranosylaminobenzene 5'-phosphate synthase